MAAVVAHDALRFAGGAGGVEDVERIPRIHRHDVSRFAALLPRRPVEIAPGYERRIALRSLHDDRVVRFVLRDLDGLVQERLVGDDGLELDAAGGGQDDLRRRVVDAYRELGRGEAAEDDGMHGADPGAGEHGDHRLRDHRHVDDHPVALADAQVPQAARHGRNPRG